MRASVYAIIAVALGSPGQAATAAEAAPICADRPGKGSATCTAPAGHFQLETGLADWTLDKFAGGRETVLVIGATAIKYGLTNRSNIELDVVPFVHDRTRADGIHDSVSGVGDLLVRYKHRLTADDAAVALSLYPLVKLPTARHALGNGRVEAGLAVPIGYAIPRSRLSLGLTPEVDWVADADGRGRHAAVTQVAGLGWAVNERWTLSAELWGRWDWDPEGTGKSVSADGSVAYLAREDVQLDAGTNFGLNRQTPDVQVYAGIAKRF